MNFKQTQQIKKLLLLLLYGIVFSIAFSHSIASILLGMLWLLFIIYRFKKIVSFNLDSITIALLSFILWCLITALWNGLSIINIGRFYYYTPILLVPLLSYTKPNYKKLFAIMTSAHIVIIFIAFLQKFGKLEIFKFLRIIESGSERLAAFSGHPIPAAGIYTILSVISISLIFFSKIEKIARFQYILFCIILSFGILLTQSRSFYIAYFVTIIIMLIHSRDKKLFLFTFLVIIMLTVCIFFNKGLSERMLSIFSESDFSNQQRIALWEVALDVISEDWKNFLFGIGYGGWRVNSLQYFAKYYPSLKQAAVHTHVHNIYLHIILETGIVGLILYLSFVVLVVKKLINKMKIHKKGDFEYAYIYGVIISIFSYFIGGIFDYLHAPAILLSLYILVTFALASGYEHS